MMWVMFDASAFVPFYNDTQCLHSNTVISSILAILWEFPRFAIIPARRMRLVSMLISLDVEWAAIDWVRRNAHVLISGLLSCWRDWDQKRIENNLININSRYIIELLNWLSAVNRKKSRVEALICAFVPRVRKWRGLVRLRLHMNKGACLRNMGLCRLSKKIEQPWFYRMWVW